MRHRFATGSLFLVEGIDAFGLLVAWNPVPVSYYFVDIKRIEDYEDILPVNAVLALQHNRFGFKSGLWNIVGSLPQYDPARWPTPQFVAGDLDGIHAPATKTVGADFSFNYDVNWERLGLTMDSPIFGVHTPAKVLRKIIETGNVAAGRKYYYSNPKPDGGEWFKRYKQERGIA